MHIGCYHRWSVMGLHHNIGFIRGHSVSISDILPSDISVSYLWYQCCDPVISVLYPLISALFTSTVIGVKRCKNPLILVYRCSNYYYYTTLTNYQFIAVGVCLLSDINDCVNHNCQNNGACVDGVNTYSCTSCVPGYSGTFCETGTQVAWWC